jgi:diguanylate cyclase (GGDEF)-like protein/PAS domain S-box-containing protein
MHFFNSPIVRISFGLVIVTISALLLSDMLGMVPDTRRAEINSRKAIAESLAVQFSMVVANEQLASVNETLKLIVERSNDIQSAALRLSSGEVLAEFGNHKDYWTLALGENSTVDQLQVPLFDKKGIWGTVELRFVDISKSHQGFFLSNSFPAVVGLVALCGFFGYWLFLKRALKELDPSSVIPDRVRLALDTLSEGLIIVNQNNIIVFSNQAFADRVGMTSYDLLGRPSQSLAWKVEAGTCAEDELPWSGMLQGKEWSENGTVTIKLSSGLDKAYKFVINASIIASPEGDIRGAMITFNDVTEVERKNAELQEAMVKLEHGQREIRRQNQELHILATRDPLTNLHNRRSFMDGFESLFNDAQQSGETISCLMVDIDFFKQVNDDFGHPVGDIVIKLLADLLMENSRPNDIVGRFGGEEFCVVLPETDSLSAFGRAELVRIAVEQSDIKEFEHRHSITASIGISNLAHGAESVKEMLEQADKALYVAKENGRNRSVRWPVDLMQDAGAGLTVLQIKQAALSTAGDRVPVTRLRDRWQVPTQTTDRQDADSNVPMIIAPEQLGPEQQVPTLPVISVPPVVSETSLTSNAMHSVVPINVGINRSILVDRIDQGIVRAERYKTKVAILSVQFDLFENSDQEQNFSITDELEKAVVQRLKDTLRSTDSVSFGDEDEQLVSVLRTDLHQVVIILPDIEDTDMISVILFRLFAANNLPIAAGAFEFFVDADVGVSIYPLDGDEGSSLLGYSKSAMREAKKSAGSNNWQFYAQNVHLASKRRRRMESELNLALERGDLVPYYQPKVCLRRGVIIGAEVLLRWSHPDFGVVAPQEFIALAEQSTLIDDITMRLITTACRQLHEWKAAGYENLTIAVNISPVQFRSPDIAEKIIARVKQNNISPEFVEFEITETVVVQNMQTAIEILNQLSSAGFIITIDDFGVGYSTFGYLNNFPVDSVKIDRSFINDLGAGPNAAAIISAIIAMAKSLGLIVIAEGVETDDELRFLQDLGCDMAQGYLIGHPLSAEGTSKLLAHPEGIRRLILNHDKAGANAHLSGASMFGIINEFPATKAGTPKHVAKK